jgi:hypothetical protein
LSTIKQVTDLQARIHSLESSAQIDPQRAKTMTELLRIAHRGLDLLHLDRSLMGELLELDPDCIQCRGSVHAFPNDSTFLIVDYRGPARSFHLVMEECERCGTKRYRHLDKKTSRLTNASYEHPPAYKAVMELVLRGETAALLQFFTIARTVGRIEAENQQNVRRIGRAG